MSEKPFHVLFVCTGNSARSIIAEALLNHLGHGRFVAYSAGSHPTGTVQPMALQALAEYQVPTHQARSKSWDEFAQPGAPELSFVFTVCNNAAGEVCPMWPGQPMTAHWGMPDPAAVEGDETIRRRAYADTVLTLKRRVELMMALPTATLDKLSLQQAISAIGKQ